MNMSQEFVSSAVAGTHDSAMAQQVLIAAGQQAFQIQGGYIPKSCPESPPEHYPPDDRPYCSEQMVSYWLTHHRQLFNMTAEFIQKFIAAQWRFPEEWLPIIIRQFKNRKYTDSIHSIIGIRGAWLNNRILSELLHKTMPRNRNLYHFSYLYPLYRNIAQDILRENWHSKKATDDYIFYLSIIFRYLTSADESFLEELGNQWKHLPLKWHIAYQLYNLPGSRFRTLVDSYADSLLDYDPESQKITLLRHGKMSQKFAVDEQYAGWDLNLWDILQIIPPTYWVQKWGISNQNFYEIAVHHKSLKRFFYDWTLAALVAGDYAFITTVFNQSPGQMRTKYLRKIVVISNSLNQQKHLEFTRVWLTHVPTREFFYTYSLLQNYPYIHTDETLSHLLIQQIQQVIDRWHKMYDYRSARTFRRYIIPQHEEAFLAKLQHYRDTVLSPDFTNSMNEALQEHEAFFAQRRQLYDLFESAI